jgi:hypothetical protein
MIIQKNYLIDSEIVYYIIRIQNAEILFSEI